MPRCCLAIAVAATIIGFAPVAAAQGAPDSTFLTRPRSIDRLARARLAADAGALWGARLDTVPLFLVHGKTIALSTDPGQPGYTAAGGGWWVGPLPAGVEPSNTALDWAGRRWAMALLPLPQDSLAAERLLVHERWHVIQPTVLPLPAYDQFGSGAAILDRPEGRIWLRLEWRALAQALAADPNSRAEAAAERDAVLFRARRYELADTAERRRERLLDLTEGMPEYTAWKLTGSPVKDLERALRTTAPAQATFARSFPYYTGPAYGLLLDRRDPGWIARLRRTLDLQRMLADALGAEDTDVARWLREGGFSTRLDSLAEDAGATYGLRDVRREETARWDARQRTIARLKGRFVNGPTLRLRPGAVRVSFNPNELTPLGTAGTVYGNLAWKSADGGALSAPNGALIDPNWTEIRVPLGGVHLVRGRLEHAGRWVGNGWTLALPAGWMIRPEGSSWVVTPPAQRGR